MKSDAAPTLEFILFEMHMRTANLVQESFTGSLTRIVEKLEGKLLFSLKLEDDASFQRCAAVLLGQKAEDECVALVFLTKDGRRVRVEDAKTTLHGLAAYAFEHWNSASAKQPTNGDCFA
jgi:hypothetical protein